ncbi:WD40 repeat domain-containing serine/threonine protein kinase [Nonomuraea sediminis]|uniref:WD40 repeat domain-containing serine/threonine protein kinase n=1 Tax=Nonomuraea sediminis TaxID=2835864 RepID=UPI001BDDAB1A|nr:serine/threonine-protein kinase [Nonomuraea sediminis]
MTSALLDGDPDRIGDYWLAGRLGAGGQGLVYEAYDPEGRRVAVKVLHGDAMADPELRVRFRKEATAARRVASFCTARVLAVELEGARPYLVSEYVEGPSLRQAVMGGRRFAGDDLHRLATAVATGLAAIHDAGVIHRDLKPDNVLLGPDGPRIIDFGLARTPEMSLTATGPVAGTPAYMAPEILTGRRADAMADVFAWGAIIVFASGGADPFTAENLGAVMHRVLTTDPDLGDLPDTLRPLVASALAKDPAARPTAHRLLLGLVSGFHGSSAELLAVGSAEAGLLEGGGADDPALGALAEDAYGLVDPADRDLVPDLFLRLVGVGAAGELTLRRLPEEELLEGRTPREQAALDRVLRLFDYLLTRRDDGDGSGDLLLARPALVHAWPRLRDWVADEREGLASHDAIRTAARHWDSHGQRQADLLHGSRLETALGWAATGRRHLVLNLLERAFLDACATAARHRVRRRGMVTVTLAALLVLALTGGVVSVRQGRTVAAQRDRTLAEQVAGQADTMRLTEPVRAMLLSVAAWRLAPRLKTRASLHSAWAQRQRAAFTDPDTGGEVVHQISRDGRRFVSVTPSGVKVFGLPGGRQIGGWRDLRIGGERFLGASLSPNGRLLAVAAGHTIRVWDMSTGRPTGAEHAIAGAALLHLFHSVEWVDDGRYILLDGTHDGALWDTRTGVTWSPPFATLSASIDPAGHLLAVADDEGRFRLLRLPAGSPVSRWHDSGVCDDGHARAVAFSPDGHTLACATTSDISLVDVRTGRSLLRGAPTPSWDSGGGLLLFSPDGRYLVAGGDSLDLIRVSDGRTLPAGRTAFDAAGFDGTTLRYLADDTAVSLDISDLVSPARLPGLTPETAAFSPDGRFLATYQREPRSLALWDVATRRQVGSLPLRAGEEVDQPAFSGDGRLLAALDGPESDTVRLWDVARHDQVATITIPGGGHARSLALTADGSFLVINAAVSLAPGSQAGRSLVWDVHRARWGRTIDFPEGAGRVMSLPGSPMGAVMDGATTRLVDALNGHPVSPPLGPGGLTGRAELLAVTSDGMTAAIGGPLDQLAFWDVRTGRRHGPVFRAAPGVDGLLFTHRGDVAASLGHDRTVQLWDVTAPRKLGAAVTGEQQDVLAAAFSPDGSILRTIDQAGVLMDIPIDPGRVADAVCARAGRTLTEPEWRHYLPDVPYQDPCPALAR